MGLLDYLNREEQERVKPVPIVSNERDIELLENPLPDVGLKNIQNVDIAEKNKENEFSKPTGMSDEDYKAALSIFSPQRVNELYSSFNPDSIEPLYQQIFQSIKKRPDVPDEKKLKAQRNVTSLFDALGLIAQGIGAGYGGYTPIRNPQLNATPQFDARMEKFRNLYRAESDAYDNGLFAALLKDVDGARGQFMSDRNMLLNFLNNLRKQRLDNELKQLKFNADENYRQERLKREDLKLADSRAKVANDNALKLARLALDTKKADLPKQVAPRGYLDFYDANTGKTYRVAEKKWKSNFTQIFNQIKEKLYEENRFLAIAEKTNGLKPSDKEEFVKQYMYDNPESLEFLKNITDKVIQDEPLSYGEDKKELEDENIINLSDISPVDMKVINDSLDSFYPNGDRSNIDSLKIGDVSNQDVNQKSSPINVFKLDITDEQDREVEKIVMKYENPKDAVMEITTYLDREGYDRAHIRKVLIDIFNYVP